MFYIFTNLINHIIQLHNKVHYLSQLFLIRFRRINNNPLRILRSNKKSRFGPFAVLGFNENEAFDVELRELRVGHGGVVFVPEAGHAAIAIAIAYYAVFCIEII